MSDIIREENAPSIHNFYNKLRQRSVLAQFIRYVEFQREIRRNRDKRSSSPNDSVSPTVNNYSSNQSRHGQEDAPSNDQYVGVHATMSIISVNLDITANDNDCVGKYQNEVILGTSLAGKLLGFKAAVPIEQGIHRYVESGAFTKSK